MCRLALFWSVVCLIAVELCVSSIAAENNVDESQAPVCEPSCGEGKCCYALVRTKYSCAPHHYYSNTGEQQKCYPNKCSSCQFLTKCCVKTVQTLAPSCASAPKGEGSYCYNPAQLVGCGCPHRMVCKLSSPSRLFGRCSKAEPTH